MRNPARVMVPDVLPLSPYEKLHTPYFASQADQRFGYYLYVPSHFSFAGADQYSLAVIVHGTGRTAQTDRSLFAEFAEAYSCIVLAPLFPAGIDEPAEVNNYKFIAWRGIRYDDVLLAIVAEVADRYRLRGDRFLLHGFSGGGHFAHRFFYLHPERLLGVSIGAPGMVTLLDTTRDWHCGVRDMAERFGRPLDIDRMRAVPVQMVIGGDDIERWEITVDQASPLWMEGVNDAGNTRLERLVALRDSFRAAGIVVRHDVVPGVAHHGQGLVATVEDFFAATLTAARAADGAGAMKGKR